MAMWREVIELLEQHPKGLITREISEHLKIPTYTVSGLVSKMAAYGAINKIRDRRIVAKTIWKAKNGVSHE